ncbi:MAG: PEP-CTERM sorting domain-containing protein [Verrucomicrobia bacterium]|nr:MAG: PEP-CTERM sorting domain-containing protein [Verrucomicrobiota bacterium]
MKILSLVPMKISSAVFSSSAVLAAFAALIAAPAAHAHIGWGGSRNFDTLVLGVTETSSDRSVGTAYGWADGTDATFGDSHRNVYFRFVLTEPTSVSISVDRVNRPIAPSGAGTQSGAHDYFLPAFSLFRIATGTLPPSTHDGATPSVNYLTSTFGTAGVAESFIDSNADTIWNPGEVFTDANGNAVWDSAGVGSSGKEGAFNALGDWKIYNDGGQLGDFAYIGHAADGTAANFGMASGISGDGFADGMVGSSFGDLVAGEYFIAVGGAIYGDQVNYRNSGEYGTVNTRLSYGLSVSVTAIPEPSAAAALAGVCALGLVASRRRRSA